MNEKVSAVMAVSDGILVEFQSGECCYYPASFLLEHQLTSPNLVFLNYDPSAEVQVLQFEARLFEAEPS